METPEFVSRRKELAKFIYANKKERQGMDVLDWYYLLGKYADKFDPDLSNMFAYVQAARVQTRETAEILSTLIHDLNGVFDKFPDTFLPRTSDFTARIIE